MEYSPHRQASSRSGRFCCGFTRGRRLALAITSRIANKRFTYAFIATSILASKFIHIHAHKTAIPPELLSRWIYTFFAQEMFLLLVFRLLLDGWLYTSSRGCLRSILAILASIVIFLTTALSVISVSFYVAAGSEVHWRNVAFAGDAAGRALLLSGIVFFVVVLGALLTVAWFAQNALFIVTGLFVDMFHLPRQLLSGRQNYDLLPNQESSKYAENIYEDEKSGAGATETENRKQNFLAYFGLEKKPWGWMVWRFSYAAMAIAILAQVFLCYIRPEDGSLVFMSWTSVCLPFIDFKSSSPTLVGINPVYNTGIGKTWDYRSAMSDPIPLPWLPKDHVPMGFEDWYVSGKKHYRAANDPLRISNREEDLLPQLLNSDLTAVPIRHVVVILLESTRKDVFPVKKDGLIWNRFKDTYDDKKLPEEAVERLQTLTPVANWLTGDYADGFHLNKTKGGRGGINFNDAYTAASYTLKSITGTLCGLTPIVADFNIEFEHNIYQPCLPQILETLNKIEEEKSDNFTSFKWSSSFLQSVTLDYDKFDRLMPALGFPEKNIIAEGYLRTPEAKFGKVELPNINYFGMAEVCLEDYIRDAFVTAKKDNERVFMTHITSTSHHPYVMPDEEQYVPLANGLDDLSHYVNAVGYDDRWLGKVFDVLEEEGVADETLVVLLGDHGLSLPENDKPPCYYNPNIGCNHVPLVISHPKLPSFDINDPVISTTAILPTILDLLLETGSLSDTSSRAVRDLISNYEGQSLVRPLHKSSTANDVDGDQLHPDWQFTIINPGRAMVGVRDARHKNRRLVVPVIENIEWQFTDLKNDPRELEPILGFEYASFVKTVEQKHGLEMAHWAEEAAFAARWWVEENNKRWHYGPYKE